MSRIVIDTLVYLCHKPYLLSSVRRLLVAACVVPSSPILVTLMKEAPGSSETSVLQESHGVTSQKTTFFIVTAGENLKSYKPYLFRGLFLLNLFKV
jgi:hypothetical protein